MNNCGAVERLNANVIYAISNFFACHATTGLEIECTRFWEENKNSADTKPIICRNCGKSFCPCLN